MTDDDSIGGDEHESGNEDSWWSTYWSLHWFRREVTSEGELLLADVAAVRVIASVTVHVDHKLLGTIKLFLAHVPCETSFSGYDTGYQPGFHQNWSSTLAYWCAKAGAGGVAGLSGYWVSAVSFCVFLANPLDSEHEVIDWFGVLKRVCSDWRLSLRFFRLIELSLRLFLSIAFTLFLLQFCLESLFDQLASAVIFLQQQQCTLVPPIRHTSEDEVLHEPGLQ